MAVWAGIAGGAAAYGQQQQQQQDDARWLERYKTMQANETQQEQARQRYIAALRPPEMRKLNTTGEGGSPMIQQQEWVLPQGDQPGSWKNVGDATPNVDFAKLDERERHNREQESAAQERLRMQGEVNAARAEAAAARGGAGGRDGGYGFREYQSDTPEGRALYDRYRRGETDPAQAEAARDKAAERKADFAARVQTRKDIAEMRNPTEGDKSTALYENQVTMGADPFASVKAGGGTNAPMSQFAGSAGQQPTKEQPASKSPYPEGTKLRGKDGRIYVVRNGEAVPA